MLLRWEGSWIAPSQTIRSAGIVLVNTHLATSKALVEMGEIVPLELLTPRCVRRLVRAPRESERPPELQRY